MHFASIRMLSFSDQMIKDRDNLFRRIFLLPEVLDVIEGAGGLQVNAFALQPDLDRPACRPPGAYARHASIAFALRQASIGQFALDIRLVLNMRQGLYHSIESTGWVKR